MTREIHSPDEPVPSLGASREGSPSALASPVLLLAVLCLVGYAYANAFDAPFIWDDYKLIVENPTVLSPEGVLDFFRKPFWPTHIDGSRERGYYRPLVMLSFAIDSALFGTSPIGFHLTNVALHLLNVSLLFLLVRRWGGGRIAAGLAAAAWGLQPRITEAVTWISGRTDVLATSFCFAALFIWSPSSRPRRWGAAACLLAGLLSKEVAVAGIAGIVLLEWSRSRGEPGRTLRTIRLASPLFGALAVYLSARALVVPAPVADAPMGALRPLLVLSTLTTYARVLTDPLRPEAQIGLVRSISVLDAVLGGALAVAFAAIGVVAASRLRPAELSALGLAAGGLLPVLHLVPLALNVVAADRFLYIPTAGIALFAALVSGRLPPTARTVIAILGLSSLPVLASRSIARNDVWGSEVRFWTEAVRTSPLENRLPRRQLAEVLFRTGRTEAMARLAATMPPPDAGDLRAFPVRRPRSLSGYPFPALEAFGHFRLAFPTLARALFEDDPLARSLLGAADLMQGLRFKEVRGLLSSTGDGAALLEAQALLAVARRVEAASSAVEAGRARLRPGEYLVRRAAALSPIGGRLARTAWRDVVRSREVSEAAVAMGTAFLLSCGDVREVETSIPFIAPRLTEQELVLLMQEIAQRRQDDALVEALLTDLESAMDRALETNR